MRKLDLKNMKVIIFITCATAAIPQALGSPWTPKPKHYKYYLQIMTIDSESDKAKILRLEHYLMIQNQIIYLSSTKDRIISESNIQINAILKERNDLSEKRITIIQEEANHLLKNIDVRVKYLRKKLRLLKSMEEEKMMYSGFEYGVNDSFAIGIDAGYLNSSFAQDYSSRLVTISLKYKLLETSNYIISVQPKFCSNSIGPKSSEFWLSGGYYDDKVYSFGIGIGTDLDKNYYRRSVYNAFTTFQKLPIKSINTSLTLFSRYYLDYTKDPVYSQTLYEQISIEKSFDFLTAYAGYFWNMSLINNTYKNSGIVFGFRIDS